jgi:hypothetical protein
MKNLEDSIREADEWIDWLDDSYRNIQDEDVNISELVRLCFSALSFCRFAEISSNMSELREAAQESNQQLRRIASALEALTL